MKVAKIAAAPMLRTTGSRLPSSAQANPPTASTAILIGMSEGTFPWPAKKPIRPRTSTKTGAGTTPILKSASRHHRASARLAVGAGGGAAVSDMIFPSPAADGLAPWGTLFGPSGRARLVGVRGLAVDPGAPDL